MRKTAFDDPTSPAALSTGDRLAATATGMVALVTYVLTLAPTVTGEDSGELVGAAWTLGVPHPPGYPVWTMLAHLFTWIPLGTPGWRVNLFSAVCGAGTISLVALIGITLTRHRLASCAAALTLAWSRVFWEQSIIAEVYTLNTLWMAVILLLLPRLKSGASGRNMALLGLLIGAGTGVHNTQVLLAPFWLVLAWGHLPRAVRNAPATWAPLMAGGIPGLVVHAYLLVAARFDPAVNWGDPDTLARWLAVLRRDQFAFMVDQYPRDVARFSGQLTTMARFWLRDLLGLGALLGLWGAVLLYRRDRLTAVTLASMAAATVVAITWMQNFEHSREWLWVMRVFLLPAELITVIGLACALAWSGEVHPRLRPFLGGLVFPLLVASLGFNSLHSKRGYYFAEDYGRNILAALPPDAIYVPAADHQAFPALYLQAVEGLRPDVTILRKYGHFDLAEIPGLEQANPDWGRFPKRRHEPEILAWLLQNTSRPLVLNRAAPVAARDITFAPQGLLVRALRAGESPGEPPPEPVWRRPLPESPVAEYSLSLIQYDVAMARAQRAFANGEATEALEALARAAEFGHREPEILNNIGVLCARHGALEAAGDYFREILSRHPGHPQATANLSRVERKLQG